MPEGNSGATPAAGATPGSSEGQQQTTPQSGAGTEGQQPTNQPTATDGDEALGEGGRKALEREREARREADRRMGELERELQTLRDKDKSEDQKARDKAIAEATAPIQTELRRTRLELDVAIRANRLGVIDLDVVSTLLEREGLIEFDKEGKPTNTEEALKELIQKRPHLVRATGRGDAGAGNNGRGPEPTADMNSQIRRAAGRRN